MEWCERQQGVDFIFGLSKNSRLNGLEEVAEVSARAAEACGPDIGDVGRAHCEFTYGALSWVGEFRVICRALCTRRGAWDGGEGWADVDRRYVVTSLDQLDAEGIYESEYCIRRQAENLIKMHKSQLSSDGLSCTNAVANQFRLVLHSAAYFLMWTARAAVGLRVDFDVLRQDLVKTGALVRATATRIHVAFSSACPMQEVLRKTLARLHGAAFIDPATPPPLSRALA